MARYRKTLWLTPETWAALSEYQARHKKRFGSQSAAVEHLLHQALVNDLGEATEQVLAPFVREAIDEAVDWAVREQVLPVLKGQTTAIVDVVSGRTPPAVRAARR